MCVRLRRSRATTSELKTVGTISILMPAHNEEACLRTLLPGLKESLATLRLNSEAIVVDDGSTDKTAEMAACHGFKVVKNLARLGKGASIRHGFGYTSGGIVATMDADGSNDPTDLAPLLRPILDGRADVVLGSRFKRQFRDSARVPILRRIGNEFFNLAIFLSTGYPVTDSQSGYRAFSRHVLDSVQTVTAGFEWETEVLLKVIAKRFRIVEVPIHYRERLAGVSRLALISDSIRFLTLIIRNLLGTLR